MTHRRTLLISFCVTIAVWLAFSWPLPRYVAEGIPSSGSNIEKGYTRRMIMGDHLQLLYNYWILADMLSGKTPWFFNMYEFNTGNDEQRHSYVTYNMPFSIVFTLGYWMGGRAWGWNFAGFISLWLTYWLTWWLLRRYTTSDWIAGSTALISIIMPDRWLMLCGGSPAGLSMAWVPMLMLGLDSMIRNASVGGGILAAFALMFSWWNDSHTFLFSLLMAPGWLALVLLHSENNRWTDRNWWKRMVMAALPLVLLVVAVVSLTLVEVRSAASKSSVGPGGRSLLEVTLYSPHVFGLFSGRGSIHDRSIFVGFATLAILAVGLIAQLVALVRAPSGRLKRIGFFVLLLCGMGVVVALALGIKGPRGGRLIVIARKLIPPYAMVRQPAKVFLIMPILVAVGAAVSLDAARAVWKRAWRVLCVGLVLVAVVEDWLQISPTICLLDHRQSAYQAVADDAQQHGEIARALVVPIWPGDSAWTSLYEHYVSLYRIRMMNGYRPVVAKEYVEKIFNVFGSADPGQLSDAQLDDLLKRGIDHVLLHEDAFPEKVSPFPVGFTIKRFLNHPRLQFLEQDQNVWAFRILPEPVKKESMLGDWNMFFPTLLFECEKGTTTNGDIRDDAFTSGGRFVRLGEGAELAMRPFKHWCAPDASLLLRLRGKGRATVRVRLDNIRTVEQDVSADGNQWIWVQIPLKGLDGTLEASPVIEVKRGAIDFDVMMYCSGRLPNLERDKTISMAAPLFFHAGYTDLSKSVVKLRKDYEPDAGIFYGPRLPLGASSGVARLDFESDAAPGTELGYFYLSCGPEQTKNFEVLAGRLAQGDFAFKSNLPVVLTFVYARNADMSIKRVVFSGTPVAPR